jgi:hypothetical protein
MSARALIAIVATSVLVGCGSSSATSNGPIAPPSSSTATSSEQVGDSVAPACLTSSFGSRGSAADQDKVDAVADAVRTVAEHQKVDGFSGLSVDSGALEVLVLWVGPIPPEMAQMSAADTQVRVVFQSAEFTSTQLLAAQGRTMSAKPDSADPAAAGLVVAFAQGCDDGSGIRVAVARRETGGPATVIPDSFVKTIRALAGDVPVLVEPGDMPVPVAAVSG